MLSELYYLVQPAFERRRGLHVAFDTDDLLPPIARRHEPWRPGDAKREESDIEIALSPNQQIALRDALRGIQPLDLSYAVFGLDGTTYSLKLVGGSNEITYKWWEVVPPAWDSLSPVVAQLDGLLHEVMSLR